MVRANKMAKRRCAVQGSSFGFYAEFDDSNDDMSLRGAQFYEVERLVDRKIRKVSFGFVLSYFRPYARVVSFTWCYGKATKRKKLPGLEVRM